jgi:hypothetical protein
LGDFFFGNYCRDFPCSGSVYETPDSGGECGVAYEAYFPMPTQAGVDKPWYSIESGPVHFTVMSTEHDWTQGSEQVGAHDNIMKPASNNFATLRLLMNKFMNSGWPQIL